METYITLLRGINVSGQKKIKMARLKELLNSSGFKNVQTYIQSGNLVFKHPAADPLSIANKIKKGIDQEWGYDVEVLVMPRDSFEGILQKSPYSLKDEADTKRLYFVFMYDLPDKDATIELNRLKFEGEEFTITDHSIYLICLNGYGKAKCNNNFFEKKLKVRATTRNLNTVQTLSRLSRE